MGMCYLWYGYEPKVDEQHRQNVTHHHGRYRTDRIALFEHLSRYRLREVNFHQ